MCRKGTRQLHHLACTERSEVWFWVELAAKKYHLYPISLSGAVGVDDGQCCWPCNVERLFQGCNFSLCLCRLFRLCQKVICWRKKKNIGITLPVFVGQEHRKLCFCKFNFSDVKCLRRASTLSHSRAVVNLFKSNQKVHSNSLNGCSVTLYVQA